MIVWEAQINNSGNSHNNGSNKDKVNQYRRLMSMCKTYGGIIDELFNPLDATNRFINLALQSVEEGSQGRQFLLESKQGIRKTSLLLKKLNNYTRKIEKEIQDISFNNE